MKGNNDNIPLVSVCIPSYNSGLYIERTISSILNQTFEDLELIICDDCSTDDTVEKIRKFDDPRIRLYINEENLGIGPNWNRCLELCRGQYIKLICADDIIVPELIAREVKILNNHSNVVAVESDTAFIDSVGRPKGSYKRYPDGPIVSGRKIARNGIFVKDYFGAPLANTFRKSVLKEIKGFDTDYKYILDYDFFLRMAFHGDIYIIHEPLNYFRLRQSSNTDKVLSSESNVYLEEHKMLLRKNRELLKLNDLEVQLSILARRILTAGSKLYVRRRRIR